MDLLQLELQKLDSEIRQSVVESDEILFSKLNRAKDVLLQKMWFAESRNLKSEIETLSKSRQTAIEVRADLTAELREQAELVLKARSRAFDEQEKHSKIQSQLYFLDQKIEQERKDINELQNKLTSHVEEKLSGEKQNETI